jgi:hypothetical protein
MKALITSVFAAVLLAVSAPGMAGKDEKKSAAREKDTGCVSVIGQVVSTRDITIEGTQVKHRLVKLETPKGNQVVVDLGDAAKIGFVKLSEGDRIFAAGKAARIGGKPVIYARFAGPVNPVRPTGLTQDQVAKQDNRQQMR